MGMIHCRIITPTGLYKECNTSILNIVSTSGQMGILPKHVPLVTMLKISKMALEEETGRETYTIAGGMLYFKEDEATILVDAIENVKDIDKERAQRAKERAEKRLADQDEKIDVARAQAALSRALNRLNTL